jgi:hypothetical protein
MELVLQKQSNQLAESGSRPIGSSGGGGGSGAAGGMGNLAQELIGSLQDLTSGIRKLVTAVQFNTRAISSIPSAGGGDGKGLENEIEGNRARDAQTGLLLKIEENTRGMGSGKAEKKDDKKQEGWSWLDTIKTFGLAIAAALGTISGLFTAQIKTMKFFGSLLMKAAEGIGDIFKRFAKFLGLDEIGANIQEKFKRIVTFVEDVTKGLRERIGNIGKSISTFFEESMAKFKKYFSFFEESDIGKKIKSTISAVQDAFTNFLPNLKESFSGFSKDGVIGKIFGGIKDFFSSMGSYFDDFAKMFRVVGKVVAKIAYPLGIIMGIWDTIQGAIAGYETGGILGAIKGGITGLINGVFLSFFDLIKDGISWILEAVGFKDAAKFLDSFSFQDLFKGLMDALFSPIETLKKAFEGLDFQALIFEPMAKAWTFLNESLGGIPQKIFDNIKLYIIDPLANAFAPVTKMFSEMASKVIGFFKDFSIPGVSIKIPFKEEPLKIGPWYPFRGDPKSEGGAEKPQGTSAATPEAANAARADFAKTDPRLVTNQPADASNVTTASKTNAEAALNRAQTVPSSNTVVNAPNNVMNKTTQISRPPIRNTEPSVSSYLRSRLIT